MNDLAISGKRVFYDQYSVNRNFRLTKIYQRLSDIVLNSVQNYIVINLIHLFREKKMSLESAVKDLVSKTRIHAEILLTWLEKHFEKEKAPSEPPKVDNKSPNVVNRHPKG